MSSSSHELSIAPNLMEFLDKTPKDLIDPYSIVANLNLDLRGFVYVGPVEGDDSPAKSSEDSPRRKQVSRRKKLSSPSSPSSLSSDVDEREGVIDDETGERKYFIERIIKYEPGRGYYVHWKGYSEADRTWQRESDMPACWSKKMKAARKRYKESLESQPFRL